MNYDETKLLSFFVIIIIIIIYDELAGYFGYDGFHCCGLSVQLDISNPADWTDLNVLSPNATDRSPLLKYVCM